ERLVESSIRRGHTDLTVLYIFFLVLVNRVTTAHASTEGRDSSTEDTIRVTTENRIKVHGSPSVRRIAPRPAAPAPAPPTGSKNSGGGNSVSRSNVSRLPSAFPEGGSVARAACTVSRIFGGA